MSQKSHFTTFLNFHTPLVLDPYIVNNIIHLGPLGHVWMTVCSRKAAGVLSGPMEELFSIEVRTGPGRSGANRCASVAQKLNFCVIWGAESIAVVRFVKFG